MKPKVIEHIIRNTENPMKDKKILVYSDSNTHTHMQVCAYTKYIDIQVYTCVQINTCVNMHRYMKHDQ